MWRRRPPAFQSANPFERLVAVETGKPRALCYLSVAMSTRENAGDLLSAFEDGRIDPAQFPHHAHVQVSYELLERHRFPEALLHLARGLRRLATKAGKPGMYHETITVAFLALIAERRLRGHDAGWEDFAARNPDLLRKELLAEIYDPAVLRSEMARETFVLPLRKSPPES